MSRRDTGIDATYLPAKTCVLLACDKKGDKIIFMDIEAINMRLAMLAKELETIYQLVNESEPNLPPEAEQRLADGTCLKCGKKITKAEQPKSKRGNHEKCYAHVLRQIKKGVYTENDAIRSGIIAPARKGGRPTQLTEIEKEIIEGKNKSSSNSQS